MDDKPNTPIRRKKIRKIKKKDKALTLFNIANLALMVNAGIVGIIKTVGDMHDEGREALTWTQIGTEITSLIVTATFVFLAIAANRISKAKKHEELTVKAHELEHNNKIDKEKEAAIASSSKTIVYIDAALTTMTVLLALIFISMGLITITQQAQGVFTEAVHYQVIGCISYIFAVLLTLLNKVIGDKLQARIDRYYLGSEVTEQAGGDSFINRCTATLYNLFASVLPFHQQKGLPLAKNSKSKSST